MSKTICFLLVIVAILSATLLVSTKAKASGKSFAGVVPFSSGDRLGFFDQSNGKVYVYDSSFSSCVFQGQLEELGKPLNTTEPDSYKTPSVTPSGIPVSGSSGNGENSNGW